MGGEAEMGHADVAGGGLMFKQCNEADSTSSSPQRGNIV